MKLPSELAPYESKALFLFAHRHVQEVVFSRGTYEIAVYDPAVRETYWPFLQISDGGKLEDSFCTCPQWEEEGYCPHIAAGYLKIFSKNEFPLHKRFELSFWKALLAEKAKELGYELELIKKGNGYFCASQGEPIFLAKTEKAQEDLEGILENRPEQTQESSIKFSRLSREELLQWKRKSPSPKLAFELSFWSDIAKYFFTQQENGTPYEITFSKKDHFLPRKVHITCDGVEITVDIQEEAWPNLIPSLSSVKSSLALFPATSQKLEGVLYDAQHREFNLDIQMDALPVEEEEKINVNSDWYYLPNKGFISAKIDPLLEKTKIPAEEIEQFLSTYGKEIEPLLKNCKIHFDRQILSYNLHIDSREALHVEAYLSHENDLKHAELFGEWLYLPSGEFYRLKMPLQFELLHTVILREDLDIFIQGYRGFLSSIRGFEVHIGGLESYVSYHITPHKDLVFGTKLKVPYSFEGMIDYDNYIFVKGRGYYPKRESKESIFRPGLQVPSSEIGDFIAAHKEDLAQVSGFFLERTPIKEIGLFVKLTRQQRILVTPKVVLNPPYEEKEYQLFGKSLYIDNEGFYPIAPLDYFPEGYDKEVLIPEGEEIFFLKEEVERLQSKILFLSRSLQRPQKWLLAVKKLQKKAKNNFVADLSYRSKVGEVSVVDLWQAFQEKKEYLFSPAGLIFLDDPHFSWIRKMKPTQVLLKRKCVKLTALEWLKLMALEEIAKPQSKNAEAVKIRALIDDLVSMESISLLDTSLLKSTLRGYQERGLAWLWFLYCYGLSGLLCDEMGLGKTHQAMALISAIFSMESKNKKKFIVICPTSVIYHWQELLSTFLPSLKVCFYHGQSRVLADDYDLILTSYGIFRHDLKKIPLKGYELAVFDEVQFAKNPHSKTHQSLSKISSTMKLGLTGTPIENRLGELKSLLDLVLPTYLPNEKVFKEQFVIPIERDQNPEAKQKLQALIKPFILRRMKAQVLKELPEKIEEISYCDLSREQRKLYNDAIVSSREEIFNEMDQRKSSAYMHVFALLMKLKQICDHPALALKDPENYQQHESGKWDLFCDLLSEVHDSQQKVVIFTQYLDMIEIIQSYLTRINIGFATIKGSTIHRKEEIDRFKKDPQCEVFIGSLLAAGVGIDLSNASVVIHYDRWWNPAKENQATDRVHRIGQKRGVQVFKLVAKNTMEERIHQIIERKSLLLSDVVGTDLDQIKSLTREELKELLKEIPSF